MSEKGTKFINGLLIEVGNMENIPVEDNTEKDYENWKKARNKRELEKPIWKNMKGEER